jgi:hypothetical protein
MIGEADGLPAVSDTVYQAAELGAGRADRDLGHAVKMTEA